MSKCLAVLILILACSCTTTVTINDAVIGFFKADQDFGSIPYKKEASYSFQFSNPGETPLLILDVKTSCGCTVPEWTKKPVKPGGAGEIKIKYDADFPGVFHKTIKVYYNGKDSPKDLSIKGEVAYPDDLERASDEI
jgi:hypothetical protein